MQVQEDGDFIPFAKCSRVVSRSPPLSLPSQSLRMTPQRYGDVFWENLSQRPSPIWTEEQYIPHTQRATGYSQIGLYPPEGLPPPELLCRRKRRKPRFAGVQQGPGGIPARVRAVAYHLEDLRKRQGIIDELKKAQWGNSGTPSEPLVLGEEGPRVPDITESTDLKGERAACLQEDDHFLTSGRAQLLWSPWSPLSQESSCLRGQSFQASYNSVTASRRPLSGPWGMEFESEEIQLKQSLDGTGRPSSRRAVQSNIPRQPFNFQHLTPPRPESGSRPSFRLRDPGILPSALLPF
ncbi:PREDICTED: protein INCA1 [Chrysochloris asiatica]|uniref:Protein INCA1 n=1 Tax=Chrysochloris asiatica TaxID=185453 RepID=A0A9B0TMM0_CHRAS|nr:PREDICTED: protein INCA1 [Chrysochloris asiatica]